MLSQNPVDMGLSLPRQQKQWAQSLHKVINGNIEMGTPSSKDSTGNWNEFAPANTNGVLVRVGAAGTSDNKYKWTAPSVGVVINHGLKRQPIGCHLVASDKQLVIWQTVVPTEDEITIAPSDSTAYATLYIF